MKNYIEKGESFSHVLTADALSGGVIVFSAAVGVAAVDGVIGDEITVDMEGVYNLAKNATEAFTKGQSLYWDATNSELTTTATGNTRAGLCWADAAAADTESLCKINA